MIQKLIQSPEDRDVVENGKILNYLKNLDYFKKLERKLDKSRLA